MELKKISSIEQLEAYQSEWKHILEENQNTNPFVEYRWIYEWWKHLGIDQAVEIIVVLENEKVIAFCPFVFSQRGSVFFYRFIGVGQANYMDIISYDSMKESVIEFVLNEIFSQKKHVVFSLHGLLKSNFTPGILDVILPNNNISYTSHQVITPFIDLEKIKMDEYFKKRQKLHRLDRREKRLGKNGTMQFIQLGEDHMDSIFKLHQKRWKKKQDTSNFTSKKEREFYRSLAVPQAGAFQTEIDGLTIDNHLIAFTYGYSCRGRYLSFVLGFNDDFEAFSPGRILEKNLILQCGERDMSVFDLSIGYETYKFDWNTDVDTTLKVIFSSKTLRAKTLRRIISLKEKLISRIKLKQKIVLFKRNKLGKLFYILKNIAKTEESREARRDLYSSVYHRVLKKIFDWKKYIIYEIDRKSIEDRLNKPLFREVTLEVALNDQTLCNKHMKDICSKVYGAFKGYNSLVDDSSYEDIFWTNDRVIRIDEVSYLKNFKKSSIFIENCPFDKLEDVCLFVKNTTKANKLYIPVKNGSKREQKLLEQYGFHISEKVTKRTLLGFNKIIIE